MFSFLVTLIVIQLVIQAVVRDTFRDVERFTFKHRLRKTIVVTILLLAYTLYQCLDEGTLQRGHSSNPYFVLGVGRTASKKEIITQARRLAKTHHPDRNDAADAATKFHIIRDSAKLLLNDNWRLAYDRFGDTLKQDYLEQATAYPNVLLVIFLWDSIRHTLWSVLLHSLIVLKDIREGNFAEFVTYISTITGLQTAILILRFSPLRSDVEVIQSIIRGSSRSFSLSESIPFIRNLTMFQRTKSLAVMGPLMLTTFRLIQPYWRMVLEEFEDMRVGRRWVPVDPALMKTPALLDGMIVTNQTVSLYCSKALERHKDESEVAAASPRDVSAEWSEVSSLLQNDAFWNKLRRVLQDQGNPDVKAWNEELERDLRHIDPGDLASITQPAASPKRQWMPFNSSFILPLLLVFGLNYIVARKR